MAVELMDRLRAIKAAIHDADTAHPDCPHVKLAHRRALNLLFAASPMIGLTQAQMDELATPPEAGTPKTPDEDGG